MSVVKYTLHTSTVTFVFTMPHTASPKPRL